MARSRTGSGFHFPSESMRGWAEALRSELEQWPKVVCKQAFGMTMVYRGAIIFAALPETRALVDGDSILLKFHGISPAIARRMASDAHFAGGTMEGASETRKSGMQKSGIRKSGARESKGEGHKWHIYRMSEDADVHRAIEWLSEAYGVAGKRSG